MASRRNSGQMYSDSYGVLDLNNNRYQDVGEPKRYERGRRRKSITVTRKDMPAIRPKSPAPEPTPPPPRPRPMKRSDSSLSRVSVASDFATIAEDAICNDFRADTSEQSYPSPGRRVSFSSMPRRLSSSSILNESSLSSSNDSPRRRVSIISLQRSDSSVSSLMDFNARRLSTVSDAVVIRHNRKPKQRRGSADGYGPNSRQIRRTSADVHNLLTGRKSFPPTSSARFSGSQPAYQSYPPPGFDNVFYDEEKSSGPPDEGSMADVDDLSYGASLRRASLASIHEMHHAVTLLKNQRALAKLQKAQRRNSSPALKSLLYGGASSKESYGTRKSSLSGSSLRHSVGPASGHARGSVASLDTHLRRLSVSSSIQDMYQKVALIKEKRLVKRLNSKVQFSVVEDAARPSDRRRGSSASARRRSSVGGSSVSAVSVSSMSSSRRGSEDSDSYSSYSGSDYSSSSSSGSSSDYSGSSSSSEASDTDSSSYSDDDEGTSSDESDSYSEYSAGSSDGEDDASDGRRSVASSGDSSETDSGNGTLSSSHGSKTDGLPKNMQDVPGSSGVRRESRQVSPKPSDAANQGNYFDYPDAPQSTEGRDRGNSTGRTVVSGHTESQTCVIL